MLRYMSCTYYNGSTSRIRFVYRYRLLIDFINKVIYHTVINELLTGKYLVMTCQKTLCPVSENWYRNGVTPV